jgi:hypothetical protein
VLSYFQNTKVRGAIPSVGGELYLLWNQLVGWNYQKSALDKVQNRTFSGRESAFVEGKSALGGFGEYQKVDVCTVCVKQEERCGRKRLLVRQWLRGGSGINRSVTHRLFRIRGRSYGKLISRSIGPPTLERDGGASGFSARSRKTFWPERLNFNHSSSLHWRGDGKGEAQNL